MSNCLDCKKEITKGHGQKRCEKCQAEHMKIYFKFKNMNIPSSARANKEYYQFYKFIYKCTDTELSILIGVHKNKIKYTKDQEEIKKERTLIKIITDEYTSKERIKEREKIKKELADGKSIKGVADTNEEFKCY